MIEEYYVYVTERILRDGTSSFSTRVKNSAEEYLQDLDSGAELGFDLLIGYVVQPENLTSALKAFEGFAKGRIPIDSLDLLVEGRRLGK